MLKLNKEIQKYSQWLCSRDDQFCYMMLSRLKMDCEYFLGYGMQKLSILHGKNIDEHIYYMQCLYDRVPIKPEWLTQTQIDFLKNKMTELINSGKTTNIYEIDPNWNSNFIVK